MDVGCSWRYDTVLYQDERVQILELPPDRRAEGGGTVAELIDYNQLIDAPKNTPMYVEIRDMPTISFQVAWSYDERWHQIGVLGSRVGYDIDGYNRNWRAWDAFPTPEEREAIPWQT